MRPCLFPRQCGLKELRASRSEVPFFSTGTISRFDARSRTGDFFFLPFFGTVAKRSASAETNLAEKRSNSELSPPFENVNMARESSRAGAAARPSSPPPSETEPERNPSALFHGAGRANIATFVFFAFDLLRVRDQTWVSCAPRTRRESNQEPNRPFRGSRGSSR